MPNLQEKFQISAPRRPAPDHNWATAESARNAGAPGMLHVNNTGVADAPMVKFNYTPPGPEIDNQVRARIRPMPLVISGQDDVSKDVNPEAFAKGFTRRHLDGADDQYTGEHMDLFYGEARTENGDVGFVERNNYLDRI